MLQGVTIRADNNQVAERIVASVVVFVMNAKNARLGGISANLAGRYHPAHSHSLTNGREGWAPYRAVCLIDAASAAIFSLFRRTCLKSLAAMRAFDVNCAFQVHSFVVALARTVFGFVGAARNVRKPHAAHGAIGLRFNARRQGQTRARAIFGGLCSILGNVKSGATMLTIDSGHGGGYAFD